MPENPMNKNLKALLANHYGPGIGIGVLEGGSRSGKTFSSIEYLLRVGMATPDQMILVCRENMSTCRASCYKDAVKIVRNGSFEQDGHRFEFSDYWKCQDLKLIAKNGTEILFLGTEDPTKLKGPQWDIAYLNEVMEISYDAYAEIQQRVGKFLLLDFNPTLTIHWVFDKILPQGRDKVFYLHSTFLDNPHLPTDQVDRILGYRPTDENIRLGTADRWRWEVMGEGKRGFIEGVVYDRWQIYYGDWPKDRFSFQKWGLCLDYGYSDPTALIEVGLSQNRLFIRQLCYESGMIPSRNEVQPDFPSIQAVLEDNDIQPDDPIVSDSARADSNADLEALGYNIIPVKKGPNSILEGIQIVRKYKMMIHPSAQKVIFELQNYKRKKQADGRYKQLPEDKHNHALDAIRYWAMNFLGGGQEMQRSGRYPRPTRSVSYL